MSPSIELSIVVFPEGGWWIAQSLEYDFAAQAKTLDDLRYELHRTIIGHFLACAESCVDPLASVPKTPERYWEMWNDSKWRAETNSVPIRSGIPHPAFVRQIKLANGTL